MDNRIKIPKLLLRPVGRAINEFKLINDSDRILIAVSGGKDSMSLFHILSHFKLVAPIKFEIGVITIDPEIEGFDPQKLKKYFKKIGVDYFYKEYSIMEQAKKSMNGDSFCAFCSRIKRGLMYQVARENNYNVLALGQHLDDLAESFMMSAFHNGKIKTMKANYLNDRGDVRVIRPLVFVRENQLREFSIQSKLPIINDNCPACFSKPTEREYFKRLLKEEEKRVPNLFKNLLNAMKPIMDEVNV
ncbi:MAG: ATP-binding protein [Gammaproteobacteria bacterium]